LEIEIQTGNCAKSQWFKKNTLKSEKVLHIKRVWWLYVIYDLICLLIFSRKKYSGVLVLVEHYAISAWLFAKFKNIHCVVVQCGTYAVKLPKEIKTYKWVLERYDLVIPISNYTKKRMEEDGIFCKYKVISLGVDKDKFSCKHLSRKNEIIFVGNLKTRKGFNFLLESYLVSFKNNPTIRLIVVGRVDRGSKAFVKIMEIVSKEGLKVDFVGVLSHDELVKRYNEAKLNILPSKSDPYFFEGFGLIHLEANACGTLTIGTFNSGNEDAIKPGMGFLVNFGDVNKLSQIILETMDLKDYPLINTDDLKTWKEVASEYHSTLIKIKENKMISGGFSGQ